MTPFAGSLFLLYGLFAFANWSLLVQSCCARGRSLLPLIGGACGLATGVLVDTPALGVLLLVADPGTLLLLAAPVVSLDRRTM